MKKKKKKLPYKTKKKRNCRITLDCYGVVGKGKISFLEESPDPYFNPQECQMKPLGEIGKI